MFGVETTKPAAGVSRGCPAAIRGAALTDAGSFPGDSLQLLRGFVLISPTPASELVEASFNRIET